MTPEDWKEVKEKVTAFDKYLQLKERERHNQMLIDRVVGVPAQPGNAETDEEARKLHDPNCK